MISSRSVSGQGSGIVISSTMIDLACRPSTEPDLVIHFLAGDATEKRGQTAFSVGEPIEIQPVT
jgi:hypothetical protein